MMMFFLTMMCFCYLNSFRLSRFFSFFVWVVAKKNEKTLVRTTNLHHEFLEYPKTVFFLTFIIHTTYKKSDDDDDVCISIDALSNRWYW